MTEAAAGYVDMYITILYTVVSMVAGAFIARFRKDYASRGAAISMFSGIFGPVFMWLSPNSKVREGDTAVWPDRSPEATVLNIILVLLINRIV